MRVRQGPFFLLSTSDTFTIPPHPLICTPFSLRAHRSRCPYPSHALCICVLPFASDLSRLHAVIVATTTPGLGSCWIMQGVRCGLCYLIRLVCDILCIVLGQFPPPCLDRPWEYMAQMRDCAGTGFTPNRHFEASSKCPLRLYNS